MRRRGNQRRPVPDLYRAMRHAEVKPQVCRQSDCLGVREPPDGDVTVDEHGQVYPGAGGLSVAPDDPMRLPVHRRPSSLGGTGKRPVWVIPSDALIAGLAYAPETPIHGLIEAEQTMMLEEFQTKLADTQHLWDNYEV